MAKTGHKITFASEAESQDAIMDEQLLRQILLNLLSNAIKFSPPGSTVRLDLSCRDEQAIFRVSDEGIGIPAEDQEHLFETFYRANNVGNNPGTGLGLAIVKRSVDVCGGTITVSSQAGHGSTFTVRLPSQPPTVR
jgi:signal transduction histidine kinase